VRSGLLGISAVDVARSRLEPTMSFSGPAPSDEPPRVSLFRYYGKGNTHLRLLAEKAYRDCSGTLELLCHRTT